jgi:hypothetical protein
MEAAIMARPKAKAAAPEPEGEGSKRRPEPNRIRSSITNIRSSPEWKEWLARFAVHTRKDLADVIDEAVLRYARAEGFELPPKR